MRGVVVAGLSVFPVIALLGAAAIAAEQGRPVVGRLAATPNGQVICRIDGTRRAIIAFDADRPADPRDVVGPAGADGPDFVAVGCLPGNVVAVVCRGGDAWSLRTYRTGPGDPVDPSAPLQDVAIGHATGSEASVDVAVSRSRGWLAVTGLPPPLPPVLRAAVAGVRVGPLSDRGCPVPPPGLRPVAAAVSPFDELVLALSADDKPTTKVGADDQLAYYDAGGRELLRLSAGVRETAGLDFNRGDGTLWGVAAAAGRRGLWRLDAALADGQQVVRPVMIAPLGEAGDLVCPAPRAIVVARSESPADVAWIDPARPASGAEP